MSKKDRKAEDILRDALKIKGVMHKKIVEKELKLGRRLTDEEKKKVKDGIKTKYRIAQIAGIGLVVLGIGAGVSNALPKGNEIPEPKTVAENSSERENFVKDLQFESTKVQIRDIDKETKDIKEFLKEEIENLDTEKQVLDYLKEFYICEYNEEKDSGYTAEQVELYRTRELAPTYQKEWVLIATIYGNDRNHYNSAYKDYTGCHTCEIEDRNIIESEYDDYMAKIAPVISAGIDRMVSMNNKDDYYEVKDNFKNNFIDEMTNFAVNYKGPTYERIMNQIEKRENTQDEIGE